MKPDYSGCAKRSAQASTNVKHSPVMPKIIKACLTMVETNITISLLEVKCAVNLRSPCSLVNARNRTVDKSLYIILVRGNIILNFSVFEVAKHSH